MPRKSKKTSVQKLASAVEGCKITTPSTSTPPPADLAKLEFNDVLDPTLLQKWPKPKMRVPTIFLHKTVDFAKHCKPLLLAGINFYQPYLGTSYTRIMCSTFNDHRAMMEYFDKNKLPFHTFGHPNKKKMRVVIRGIPKDADLGVFFQALKAADVPIVRVHKMHMKEFLKNQDSLVLAVVPYCNEGQKLLRLKKAFGCDVTLEPPIEKTRQCHRCQKWGHSQRYCHGQVKCVKCAGDHWTSKCQRGKEESEEDPPTCANCGGNHTASYRECFCCPDSTEYKNNKNKKINKQLVGPIVKRQLVKLEDLHAEKLYKRIKNIPKHNEAVPF